MLRPSNNIRSMQGGFTLIEIAIVVAVLGVLAAIAIPHYRVLGMKARRTEAIYILTSIRIAEADHYLEKETYTASLATLLATGVLPQPSSLLFYQYRPIATSSPILGYVASVMGNIDLSDPTWDILALKVGKPGGEGGMLPEGISIITDDVKY